MQSLEANQPSDSKDKAWIFPILCHPYNPARNFSNSSKIFQTFSVSSNEISHFDNEINDNSFEDDHLTSKSHSSEIQQKPYKFIEEPDDIHAQLGTSLTLNCVFSHTNGNVQWTKNHFGLGVDRELMAYKRYSMVGDEKNGSYSLHIVDVNFEDEGFYQCQFSNHDVQMRSRYATVTVFREIEVVTKEKICFSEVGDAGGAVKHERLEANGSHMDALNSPIIFGVFCVLSFI